jgi:hypothetical protein
MTKGQARSRDMPFQNYWDKPSLGVVSSLFTFGDVISLFTFRLSSHALQPIRIHPSFATSLQPFLRQRLAASARLREP